MIRPPLGSSLFPYTTLFRSLEHERSVFDRSRHCRFRLVARVRTGVRLELPRSRRRRFHASVLFHGAEFVGERSEEHTSELQSHSDLVCRLLLEKKKKTNKTN